MFSPSPISHWVIRLQELHLPCAQTGEGCAWSAKIVSQEVLRNSPALNLLALEMQNETGRFAGLVPLEGQLESLRPSE